MDLFYTPALSAKDCELHEAIDVDIYMVVAMIVHSMAKTVTFNEFY